MDKNSEQKSETLSPFEYRSADDDELDPSSKISLSTNTDESGDQKQKPSSESSLVNVTPLDCENKQVAGAVLNLSSDTTANDTDYDIAKLSDPSFDRLTPLAYHRELEATRSNDTDCDIEQYSEPSYDTRSPIKYQRKTKGVLKQTSITTISSSFDESVSKASDNLEQGADAAVNKFLEDLKQTAATSLNTASDKADNREESSKTILSRNPDEELNKTQDNLETAAMRSNIAVDEEIDNAQDNLKQDAATNSNIDADDGVKNTQDDQKQIVPTTSSNIAADEAGNKTNDSVLDIPSVRGASDEVANKPPKEQKAPATVEDRSNNDDKGKPIISNQTKFIYAVVLSMAIYAGFKYFSKNSEL